jgi:TPP-dependent pyruvate/acetoin dehydrogenase alpha subunit
MGAGPRPSRLADDDLALLLLIRHFEQAVLDLFGQGKLHGTTHTCLGQEYIPVALAPLLGDRDYVFSNHRGHGHYLARFEDPSGLLAEVMGRDGAVCRGVGGSQRPCTSSGMSRAGSRWSTWGTERGARARSMKLSTWRRCGRSR